MRVDVGYRVSEAEGKYVASKSLFSNNIQPFQGVHLLHIDR